MSVEVELAALEPKMRPAKFRAIGDVGNRVMDKYRAFGWDESVSVEENLINACIATFPPPASSVGIEEEDDPDISCGICYGYTLLLGGGEEGRRERVATEASEASNPAYSSRLQTTRRSRPQSPLAYNSVFIIVDDDTKLQQELPDIICPTSNCAKPYHHSCLFEWLRGDRESTISFDRIHGSCMYCEGKVSCKMRRGKD